MSETTPRTALMSNTLRVRRAERRMSQRHVAAVIGVSHWRYYNVENGFLPPTQAEVDALLAIFGVPVDVLYPHGVDVKPTAVA